MLKNFNWLSGKEFMKNYKDASLIPPYRAKLHVAVQMAKLLYIDRLLLYYIMYLKNFKIICRYRDIPRLLRSSTPTSTPNENKKLKRAVLDMQKPKAKFSQTSTNCLVYLFFSVSGMDNLLE